MQNLLISFTLYIFSISTLAYSQVKIPFENENWKQLTPIYNKIYSIAVDGDTVWAGSDVGFFKVNINTGESVNYNRINSPLTDNWVIGIIVDSKHNKWIGTQEKGLIKVNGDVWKIFDEEYFKLFGMNIRTMTIEKDTLWISTWGDGLIKFNVVDHSYEIFTTENSGLIYDAIYNVFVDNEGKKWITTMLGVCLFHNNAWSNITEDNKDLQERTVAASVDDSGNLWILNNKPAIVKYKNGEYEEYEIPSNLFEYGFCDAEVIHANKENHVLVGTDDGVIEFNKGTWSKVAFNNKTTGFEFVQTIICDNQNRLWIGGWNGLFCFDGIEWKQYATGNSLIADSFIHSIEIDRENKVWITSSGGLNSFKDGKWEIYDESNSGLIRNYLTDLVIDSLNNKWIVQIENGLVMFNDKENIWKVYDTLNSPLPDNHIMCLSVDKKGVLWIGTRKGLCSYDGTNWKIYSKENSNLPKSGVSKIAFDKMNNLWFVSSEFDLKNRGDKLVLFDGTEFRIIDFTTEFPNLENKSFYGLWIDDRDRKWISACDELYWYENNKWNVMDRNSTQIFFSCLEDIKSDGNDIVVCSSMGGLIRYNGKKFMALNEENSFVPDYVSCFNMDAFGNKWIGTQNKGIIIHNPQGIQYGNASKK